MQTLSLFVVLPTFTRTRCRFGNHLLGLTLCAWLILLPKPGDFPHMSHLLAIY